MKNLEDQAPRLVMVAMALALSASVEAAQRPSIFSPVRDDPLWNLSDTRPSDRSEVRPSGYVRVQVVPKQTEVYVDGEYAGLAGQFGGLFRQLRTTPAAHRITFHLEGFRTVTEDIYVAEDSTFKIHRTMDTLRPGEVSAPVPDAPARAAAPGESAGTANRQ